MYVYSWKLNCWKKVSWIHSVSIHVSDFWLGMWHSILLYKNVIFEKLTQGNALHILHSILISTVKVNFMLWRFLQKSIECSIMLCLALVVFFFGFRFWQNYIHYLGVTQYFVKHCICMFLIVTESIYIMTKYFD